MFGSMRGGPACGHAGSDCPGSFCMLPLADDDPIGSGCEPPAPRSDVSDPLGPDNAQAAGTAAMMRTGRVFLARADGVMRIPKAGSGPCEPMPVGAHLRLGASPFQIANQAGRPTHISRSCGELARSRRPDLRPETPGARLIESFLLLDRPPPGEVPTRTNEDPPACSARGPTRSSFARSRH